MKVANFTVCAVLLTLLAISARTAIGDVVVTNPGFEEPVLGSDQGGFYSTTGEGAGLLPTIPGWTFTQNGVGPAGMLSATAIGAWGAQAFDNQCAAFSTDATIAQTITGFSVGDYRFSFYAQASGTGQPLTVKLDDTTLTFGGIGSVTPTDTMSLYTSNVVSVGAGDHTLLFTAGGWTYLDNVSVAVPEPASLAMVFSGLIGLLAYAWRKRR